MDGAACSSFSFARPLGTMHDLQLFLPNELELAVFVSISHVPAARHDLQFFATGAHDYTAQAGSFACSLTEALFPGCSRGGLHSSNGEIANYDIQDVTW